MSIFNGLKKNQNKTFESKPGIVHQPVEGNVIPLKELGDGVFSEGILGEGCGIKPSGEMVYSPFDGEIIQVIDTKHALGIKSKDGIELLIHVGIDTVNMNGKDFNVKVKKGDMVKAGQAILQFSRSAVRNAGYSDTIAVIITNTGDFSSIKLIKTGDGVIGNEIINAVK